MPGDGRCLRHMGDACAMAQRYPEVEPYESGMLPVGDGHELYWETVGQPVGVPALLLHGGPGQGCTAGMRRSFDPDTYRAVLFDQRGCGRSRPLASDPEAAVDEHDRSSRRRHRTPA